MKDYTIRFVYDRKNETGFRSKDKKKGSSAKKFKEDGLLQIEVKKDGTDKRVYISTNIRIRPDQFIIRWGLPVRITPTLKGLQGRLEIG